MTRKVLLLAAALFLSAGLQAKDNLLKSPDGTICVTVSDGERVTYSVERSGAKLIAPSQISMSLLNGRIFGANDRYKVTRRSGDHTYPARNFKRSSVRDRYNELVLSAADYDIVFRAYDDGVAYRFVSRGKSSDALAIAYEQAEFAFPYDFKAYIPYVREDAGTTQEEQFFNSFENVYSRQSISHWEKGRLAFLPLTVMATNGIKLCITESDLSDYPGMYLSNMTGGLSLRGVFAACPGKEVQGGHNMLQGIVQSRRNFIAMVSADHAFPWRVIGIATEDRKLADSDLTWRLARPAEAKDWSWVKPGKVAWDWWNDWNLYGVDFEAGINNETYKYYIDFASSHGIEYVILDEGWAVNKQADLMQVVPEIDLPMLCRYAEERNVGLILWAGYWAFNRDMEGVCRHYSEMGIKGWKIDFMNRDDQEMVRFCEQAAAVAAKYRMVVDFHGMFKPAGMQRTYPNVLNFEGVHGLEQLKWSTADIDMVTYDVTIPYARLFAGPADYTQGAMRNATRSNYHPVNSEAMSQGTRCHQLAEYVVFDAPLTMLCDSPSNYLREPECTELITSIPTVWDETIALDGKIAEYVVIARRSGSDWYVGVLGNWDERDLEIDLSQLKTGPREGDAYVDGINAHRAARDYRHEKVSVDKTWKVHLAPGGGAVLKL